jgi:hypothetical protein
VVTRAALSGAGVEVTTGPDTSGVDAELWLADAVSVEPRPTPGRAVRPGGAVLVEASLGADELTPVAVTVDRVALVVGRGPSTRRIDAADGEMQVRVLAPWPLPQLDDRLAANGCRLERRTVDWVGGAVDATSPCHLSWFRNVRTEPGDVDATSHR